MADRQKTPADIFAEILDDNEPLALAWVTGGTKAPYLSGLVKFFETPYGGTLIEAELFGLPDRAEAGSSDFYAMHIHEYGDCGNDFQNTGGHYNPTGAEHPAHAGDLLPLFTNQGYAWISFYDKRFLIPQILGRSVVIHQMPDDFHTQPSGNSGDKIGCGVIRLTNRRDRKNLG